MAVANVRVTQVLLKRGNTTVSNTYIGTRSELTHDTGTVGNGPHNLRIHDGRTPGGTLIASQGWVSDALANISATGGSDGANVTISNTAPVVLEGNLWYNDIDGRAYVYAGGVWRDFSPQVVPANMVAYDALTGDIILNDGSAITYSNGVSILDGLGGGGNPFDQNLNTTDNVNFANVKTGTVNLGENELTAFGPPNINGTSDKIRLWDFYNEGAQSNYAMGVESDHIWLNVDNDIEALGFKFYGNANLAARISAAGNLFVANRITFPDGTYMDTAAVGGISNYGNANVVSLLANFGSNVITTSGQISAGTLWTKAADGINGLTFSPDGSSSSAYIRVDGGQNALFNVNGYMYLRSGNNDRVSITNNTTLTAVTGNVKFNAKGAIWEFGSAGAGLYQIDFPDGTSQFTAYPGPQDLSGYATTANLNAFESNVGSFYTWANLTFGTSSYSDSNVSAYLLANPQSGTYSNSNVASYLIERNIDSQLQSDYTQADTGNVTYIKNKPDLTVYATTTSVNTAISTAINNLINSAPGTLDTLGEIAANLASEAGAINSILSSITSTNSNVATFQANVGSFYTWANLNYITTPYSNTNVAAYLVANPQAGTYSNTNVASYLSAHNIAAQLQSDYTQADSANVTYIKNKPDLSVYATNTALQTLNANVGAYETWANANLATQTTNFNTLNANVGAYETWANAHFSTSTYSNANANALLSITSINSLIDVDTTTVAPSVGQVLEWDGTNWVPGTVSGGGGGGIALTDLHAANTTASGSGYLSYSSISGTFTYAPPDLSGYATTTSLQTLNANLGAYQTWANANVSSLQNQITGANTNIQTLNANIGSYQTWANANLATQTTNFNTLNANVGAYEIWANANAASQGASINTINANLGSYQTWANAQVQTINANLGGFETWANLNYVTSTSQGMVVVSNVSYYPNVSATTTNAIYYPGIYAAQSGNLATFTSANLSYVPATGNLTATGTLFIGDTNNINYPYLAALITDSQNGYNQVIVQNLNSGNKSTSDFVVTANNGNDSTFFVDLGITGNTYNNAAPINALGTSVFPNDGYLYMQGNTSSAIGGNLIIGTVTPNRYANIIVGGAAATNVVGSFSSSSLTVYGNTNTTQDFVATGNVWAQGGYFRTGATTAYIVNQTPTTVYIAGNASIGTYIGNASGVTQLNGNVQGSTNGFAIGYRDIPQLTLSGNATLAYSDAGKHYYSTSGSNYTITIPTNSSVAFNTGAAINVINQGTGTITVAGASGVYLYMAGNSTSGGNSRTISSYGVATIQKVATDTWFIVGVGLA